MDQEVTTNELGISGYLGEGKKKVSKIEQSQ